MGSNSDNISRRRQDSFLFLHPFMWEKLKLRGIDLLVFARVYGFCKGGGTFYESRAGTAAYLGISERSVTRSIGHLANLGIIIEGDQPWHPDGVSTRVYRLGPIDDAEVFYAEDNLSPPDSMSRESHETDDNVSDERVTDWHLKKKSESKS